MGRPSSQSELTLADKAVAFIQNLTLTGDYLGEPFILRSWQEDFVRRLFATDEAGKRLIDRGFLALPRKQAKSTLIAAIMLFLLVMGKGQEIYSASGDRAQASLIFSIAEKMIAADPTLSKLCSVYHGLGRREIVCDRNGNTFKALSSDAPTKHGLNPSCVLFDEVHVLPNRDLHDVLTTAMGARRDSLTLYITTAGRNKHSLCYELWTYADKVSKGLIDDPYFLSVIYAAPMEDDWTTEETWKRAMPALGDFCELQFIKRECDRAKAIPAYENSFRQLYLNQWIGASHNKWLSLDAWDACKVDFNPDDYAGRECYAGLDLSTIHDLSAFVLIFPEDDGSLTLIPQFFAPRDPILEKERLDGVPYSVWARQGAITLIDGEVIDYDVIEQAIVKANEQYDIIQLGSDPWNFSALGQRLMNAGINVVKFGQSTAYMTFPSKEFERLITTRKIRHDGNPCMRFCIENVSVHIDANDNIRPSKDKSTGRIDGVSAAVTAIGTMFATDFDQESVYTTRGILTI